MSKAKAQPVSEPAAEEPVAAGADAAATDAAAAATDVDPRLRIARIWAGVIIAGGLLTIVSAFLPWVALHADTEQVITGLGAGGDGAITAALALLSGGMAAWGLRAPAGPTRRTGLVALITGFLVLSIPALRWSDFRSTLMLVDQGLAALVSPEIGLYGTAIGGLITIVGGWQLRRLLRPMRAEVRP